MTKTVRVILPGGQPARITAPDDWDDHDVYNELVRRELVPQGAKYQSRVVGNETLAQQMAGPPKYAEPSKTREVRAGVARADSIFENIGDWFAGLGSPSTDMAALGPNREYTEFVDSSTGAVIPAKDEAGVHALGYGNVSGNPGPGNYYMRRALREHTPEELRGVQSKQEIRDARAQGRYEEFHHKYPDVGDRSTPYTALGEGLWYLTEGVGMAFVPGLNYAKATKALGGYLKAGKPILSQEGLKLAGKAAVEGAVVGGGVSGADNWLRQINRQGAENVDFAELGLMTLLGGSIGGAAAPVLTKVGVSFPKWLKGRWDKVDAGGDIPTREEVAAQMSLPEPRIAGLLPHLPPETPPTPASVAGRISRSLSGPANETPPFRARPANVDEGPIPYNDEDIALLTDGIQRLFAQKQATRDIIERATGLIDPGRRSIAQAFGDVRAATDDAFGRVDETAEVVRSSVEDSYLSTLRRQYPNTPDTQLKQIGEALNKIHGRGGSLDNAAYRDLAMDRILVDNREELIKNNYLPNRVTFNGTENKSLKLLHEMIALRAQERMAQVSVPPSSSTVSGARARNVADWVQRRDAADAAMDGRIAENRSRVFHGKQRLYEPGRSPGEPIPPQHARLMPGGRSPQDVSRSQPPAPYQAIGGIEQPLPAKASTPDFLADIHPPAGGSGARGSRLWSEAETEKLGVKALIKRGISQGLEEFGQKVRTRVANISRPLAYNLSRVTQATHKGVRNDIANHVDKFFTPAFWSKAKGNKLFTSAMLNRDLDTMESLIPGSADSFRRHIQPLLNRVFDERKAAGLPVIHPEQYFPRGVKDLTGLRRSMGTIPGEADLHRALQRRGVRFSELSPTEQGEVLADHMAQWTRSGKVSLDRARSIPQITPDMLKYYDDPMTSLLDMLHSHHEELAELGFFQALGPRIKQYGSALHPDGLEESLTAAVESGNPILGPGVAREDVIKLARLLGAHFGAAKVSPRRAVRAARNTFTAGVLGNPFAALTQLADPAFTAWRYGMRDALMAALPGDVSRAVPDIYDLGLRSVAQELRDGGLSSLLVQKSFKWSGFAKVDEAGASHLTRTIYRQLVRQAEKQPQKLAAELAPWMGRADVDRTLRDLRAGVVSDDVKTLILHRASDVRPIDRADMPLSWQQHPNGRILYSLLSWSINQFNTYRTNVLKEITDGFRSGDMKRVVGGIADGLRLPVLMYLAQLPISTLKAGMAGREFDPTSPDQIMAAALPFGLTPRFLMADIIQGDPKWMIGVLPVVSIAGKVSAGMVSDTAQGHPVDALMNIPTFKNWAHLGGFLTGVAGGALTSPVMAGVPSDTPDPVAIQNHLMNGTVPTNPANAVMLDTMILERMYNDILRQEYGSWDRTKFGGQVVRRGSLMVPYQDSEGFWTVGPGFNLEAPGADAALKGAGITDRTAQDIITGKAHLSVEESQNLFRYQLDLASRQALVGFPMFHTFDHKAQEAIVNMVYQMGMTGVQGFSNAIAALNRHDYPGFLEELRDSAWYKRQTPSRAKWVVAQIEESLREQGRL